MRYCDTIGGDSPGRIRERFAKLASATGIPVETHCHNDLGMAVANSVSGALGDLDAGQDAWINTCVNGIGERAGNADLLSCILAFRYGFGVSESRPAIGDPVDLSWARRFGLWAAYAFGQPLPPAWPGVGRNAFAHESGIHADGALKDRGNYELYDDSVLGPFPSDWFAREGRVVLTGEYGGKAGFRHVLDGLGIAVADGDGGPGVLPGPAVRVRHGQAADRRRAAADRRVSAAAGAALPRAAGTGPVRPAGRADPSPERKKPDAVNRARAFAASWYAPYPCEGAIRGAGEDPGRRLGRRGGMGLVSTIGPVAVGVVLAFGWNMTVSQPQRAAEAEPGVTPRVGVTVEEAAAQAWASATPRAATDNVPAVLPRPAVPAAG